MKLKNELGFTLVELLVAGIIMAIVAAIAAPGFSGLIRNYKLTNAARVVWLDLQRAKMMAIKQRTTMQVDFTSTLYTIARADTPTPAILSRNLSSDYPGITVSLVGTAQSVSFTSTGTLLPPNKTVQIQGPTRSKSFTIITTGRIGQIS